MATVKCQAASGPAKVKPAWLKGKAMLQRLRSRGDRKEMPGLTVKSLLSITCGQFPSLLELGSLQVNGPAFHSQSLFLPG